MFQQDSFALVMKETDRIVYPAQLLNLMLDGLSITKNQEKELTLPVGLTVQCVGFATDDLDRRVGVFIIVRSQLGNDAVKEFSKEYENWVFLMSEERQLQYLKEL